MTPGKIHSRKHYPDTSCWQNDTELLIRCGKHLFGQDGQVRTNMHACVCVGVYGDLFRNEIVMRRNVSMYVWIRTLMGLKIRNSEFMKVHI